MQKEINYLPVAMFTPLHSYSALNKFEKAVVKLGEREK
jgi:hypothetical protein